MFKFDLLLASVIALARVGRAYDRPRVCPDHWVSRQHSLYLWGSNVRSLALLVVLFSASSAEARTPRVGDVTVTITLRESVAALSWINATNPTAKSAEEMHDLLALFDDAGLSEARAYVDKIPPARLRLFALDQVPATATPRSLSRNEARVFESAIAPSKDHPQELSLGRVLSALSDKLEAALAATGPKK